MTHRKDLCFLPPPGALALLAYLKALVLLHLRSCYFINFYCFVCLFLHMILALLLKSLVFF